jgi:hypothetical protein
MNKQSVNKEQKRKQAEQQAIERAESRASRGSTKIQHTLANRERRIAKDAKAKLDAANKRFLTDAKRPKADSNHARAKTFIPPFSASHGYVPDSRASHIALVRELKNREASMYKLEARAKLREAA